MLADLLTSRVTACCTVLVCTFPTNVVDMSGLSFAKVFTKLIQYNVITMFQPIGLHQLCIMDMHAGNYT